MSLVSNDKSLTATDIEKDFNPRLRWAIENNEDMGLLAMAKKSHDMDIKVLEVLKKMGPMSAAQIALQLQVSDKKIYTHLGRLKNRSVKIRGIRIKNGPPHYEIEGRIPELKFYYNNNYKY